MGKKTIAQVVKRWYNSFKKKKGGAVMAKHGNVNSVDFAIYLNQVADKMGLIPNVTKIQKWLYICYGLYLVVAEKPLLNEQPTAWQYGPFFEDVHKRQKRNKDTLYGLDMTKTSVEEMKQYDEIIKATLDHFGDWSASDLVRWTHQEDSAWFKKYHFGQKYKTLDNNDIFLDFKQVVVNKE